MSNIEPILFKKQVKNYHFFIFKEDKIIVEFDFECVVKDEDEPESLFIQEIKNHREHLKNLLVRIEDELIKYEGSEDKYLKEYNKYKIVN